MGAMILPLVVVLVAGLLVLGLVCAERFPVRSWPSRIRGLVRDAQEVRQEEQEVEVEVVPQEVHLADLMTREGPTWGRTPSVVWWAFSRRRWRARRGLGGLRLPGAAARCTSRLPAGSRKPRDDVLVCFVKTMFSIIFTNRWS